MLIACGSGGDSKADSDGEAGGELAPAAGKGSTPEGVCKFGQSIKFHDDSALEVDSRRG